MSSILVWMRFVQDVRVHISPRAHCLARVDCPSALIPFLPSGGLHGGDCPPSVCLQPSGQKPSNFPLVLQVCKDLLSSTQDIFFRLFSHTFPRIVWKFMPCGFLSQILSGPAKLLLSKHTSHCLSKFNEIFWWKPQRLGENLPDKA